MSARRGNKVGREDEGDLAYAAGAGYRPAIHRSRRNGRYQPFAASAFGSSEAGPSLVAEEEEEGAIG